ncbi:protein 5NUC-like [Haemaphysalis longicornis]
MVSGFVWTLVFAAIILVKAPYGFADVEVNTKKETFNVTILHTNDIHSRILQSDKNGRECDEDKIKEKKCFGGVPRIVHKVRELKKQSSNPLFLNAGDFYQGTLWYSILKYNIVSLVMANMSYDTVCLGNHEFDDGPAGLVPFLLKMNESNVTVLGTNLDTSGEPLFDNIKLRKSIVYEIEGEKVAVLGVVTTETNYIARPGGVKILSEADSINEEIRRLQQDEQVKIFVLVSHVGFDVDKKLADACPELDLIVGGHTNTFLYTGKPPREEDEGIVEGPYPYIHNRSGGSFCLIVQDYRFGKYLGFLNVLFDRKGNIKDWFGNPILLDHNIEEDECMLQSLQPYKKMVQDAVKKVVGSSKVLLEANNKLCRHKECNSVNLMTDAFLDYYTNRDSPVEGAWSIVNAAIVNGGISRDSIDPSENVTLGDLLKAMPYDSDLVVMNMTGRHLRAMFEYSVNNFTWEPDLDGKFLQVSGARVVYNFSFPNGCRVVSLQILCANCSVPVYEDVVDGKAYSIVTTSFLAYGGDGYTFEESVTKKTEGVSATDVFVKYFTKMSPIKTPEEGRVIVIDLPEKPNITTTSAPTTTSASTEEISSPFVLSRADWRAKRRNFLW